MNSVVVPAAFQTRSIPGALTLTRGRNIEEAFIDWMLEHADELDTDAVFLPVTWWMNSVKQLTRDNSRFIFAVPEVSDFLGTLDPALRYVTVSRGDDGPYECLPPHTIVFGTSGEGDIPIPLLPPPSHANC